MFRMLRLSPPHGWRAVGWELVIVTVGVLVALFAEQSIVNRDWRQKSRAAETEIRAELLASAAHADERLRMSKCFEGKLDQLQDRLLRTNEPIAAPMYQSRYWTLVRLWSTDAWETARAGDVLMHMPPERVRFYAALYRQIGQIRANLALEQQHIADLAMLTWFSGPLSDTMRDRLFAAVTRARRANEMIIRDSGQLLGATGELGIRLTPESRHEPDKCGSMDDPMS